jgi:DNA-binding response OmpR family regulator
VLRGYLEKAGFSVLTASSGPEALRVARQERPDLIILDLMLPGMDGLDVCRALRKESDVPIIMLTARVEETDRLIGLELGADDYVSKPFSPREVVARVRAVLRRTQAALKAPEEGTLVVGDLRLDVPKRLLFVGERQVELTPSEFEILRLMMRSPGRVFSREQLLEATQGVAYEGYERTIDTHIKNLRRKIEKTPGQPEYILTVHGVGYKMREES